MGIQHPAPHLCANRAIVPFPVGTVRHQISAKGMARSVGVVGGRGLSFCGINPVSAIPVLITGMTEEAMAVEALI